MFNLNHYLPIQSNFIQPYLTLLKPNSCLPIQSLVDRLHLNAEDITIQPVHPSIIGQDTWFQITYSSSGTTRYFSCQVSTILTHYWPIIGP